MKKFNTKGKIISKTLLGSVVMVGFTTLIFQGLTQAAVTAEIEKKDIIPTSYLGINSSENNYSNDNSSDIDYSENNYSDYNYSDTDYPDTNYSGTDSSDTNSSDMNSSDYNLDGSGSSDSNNLITTLPFPTNKGLSENNYPKANYILIDNALEYYRDKKPTDKDISREMAAKIGAKALWTIFELDLEDKVLEMAYNPATEDNRAIWEGNYWVDGIGNNTQVYFFSVDAITGELHSIQYTRTLTDEIFLKFDGDIAKNPLEYTELAKIVAEKYNVVHGLVKSYDHTVQGYTSNDPTIAIRIIGENGEQAQIGFSRYDKTLLSISYDSWCQEADAAGKKIEEEMKRKAEMQKNEDIIIPFGSEEPILVPES